MIVLSIGMAVNDALSEDDLGQGFEFEVNTWRGTALGRAILDPAAAILDRGAEGVADELLDPHARLWVTGAELVAPVNLTDVFT